MSRLSSRTRVARRLREPMALGSSASAFPLRSRYSRSVSVVKTVGRVDNPPSRIDRPITVSSSWRTFHAARRTCRPPVAGAVAAASSRVTSPGASSSRSWSNRLRRVDGVTSSIGSCCNRVGRPVNLPEAGGRAVCPAAKRTRPWRAGARISATATRDPATAHSSATIPIPARKRKPRLNQSCFSWALRSLDTRPVAGSHHSEHPLVGRQHVFPG